MNTYRIAQKDSTLRAVNIDEKDGIAIIRSLEDDGYMIVTSLIEAGDPEEAVQQYLSQEQYLSQKKAIPPEYQEPVSQSEEEPEKDSLLWDIFRILFVIAMIIAAEM